MMPNDVARARIAHRNMRLCTRRRRTSNYRGILAALHWPPPENEFLQSEIVFFALWNKLPNKKRQNYRIFTKKNDQKREICITKKDQHIYTSPENP